MRWRELSSWMLLGALVAVFAGAAWVSRNPASPLVDRAARWPLVGAGFAWVQTRYGVRPPPPPPVTGPEDVEDGGGWLAEVSRPPAVAAARPPHGQPEREVRPAEPERAGARPEVWVGPGVPLYVAPERGSEPLPRLELLANLEVRERRGDWVLVSLPAGGEAWLEDLAWTRPPLGEAAVPAGPLAGLVATPARLARARAELGAAVRQAQLGSYPLLTDVPAGELPPALDAVVAGLAQDFAARYGQTPQGSASETVVVFARREAYDRFKADEPNLRELPAHGHVSGGLIALAVEARPPRDVVGTVVHEITHTLSRRALGPALPAWLDEGIADDLGLCEVGPEGRLRLGSLATTVVRRGNELEIHGGWASLSRLRQGWAGTDHRELVALLDRDWHAFVTPARREVDYAASVFLVRYLLDGGDPALRAGFLSFLAAVAAGGRGDAAALAPHLGVPMPLLAARLRSWLEHEERKVERAALGPGVRLTAPPGVSAGASPARRDPTPRDGASARGAGTIAPRRGSLPAA